MTSPLAIPLRRFELCFQRLHRSARKHRNAIIALSLVAFAGALWCLPHSVQTVSIEDQLDPSLEAGRELRELKAKFPSGPDLALIVRSTSLAPFTSHELCEIQKWLARIATRSDLIEDVATPFDFRRAMLKNHELSYPRAIGNPCLEPGRTLDPLQRSPWAGIAINRQETDLLVQFSLRKPAQPGRYGNFDPLIVKKVMDIAETGAPATLSWSGTAALQYFTLQGLEQSRYVNWLIAAILLICLRACFGTWISGAVFLATVLFSVSLVYGGMVLSGHPIDPLAICLFLMLTLASLEDFVFLSNHQLKHFDHSPWRGFRAQITPSFFTSVTTAMGFGSLMISPLSSIRRFGLWALVGTMLEWGAVYLLLPAFLERWPRLRHWVRPDRATFLRNATQRLARWAPPRRLAYLSLGVFFLAAFAIPRLELAQTPSEIFPESHPFQQGIRYLERSRGWVSTASLVFNTNFDAELRRTITDKIRLAPEVAAIETPEAALRFLQNEVGSAPIKALVERDFLISPLGTRYFSVDDDARSILYLNTTDTARIHSLRQQVRNLCPQGNCQLVGEFVALAEQSERLIRTLFDSLFLGLGLVGFTLGALCLSLKRIRDIPLILISSFWGVAALLTYLLATGTRANFMTCITASVVVGLTGNNAIQFLFGARRSPLRKGILIRGSSAIQCTAIAMLCALGFLGSSFEPTRNLGSLLAMGFAFALFGDIWILQGLASRSEKRPETGLELRKKD